MTAFRHEKYVPFRGLSGEALELGEIRAKNQYQYEIRARTLPLSISIAY